MTAEGPAEEAAEEAGEDSPSATVTATIVTATATVTMKARAGTTRKTTPIAQKRNSRFEGQKTWLEAIKDGSLRPRFPFAETLGGTLPRLARLASYATGGKFVSLRPRPRKWAAMGVSPVPSRHNCRK